VTKLLPTGIPGLDELLNGGIPESRVVLVIGGPGSGKTTLASQFLYKGISDYN
jgi:KaiC/GvpD/RAD55 family RecA-like ATPase